MVDDGLADVRASVRVLSEMFGQCADCMIRADPADLERCRAVGKALRAMPTVDDRVLYLVGQLEALVRDRDPFWSNVGAIALVLGDLDTALRPD
ncbi:hypothetical protein ODJ79_11565 [Actinoplanes sp. KI2]|uniref:hypothetical protein n=1 Tax=Actinoplanes sp. KI2 TaxID=2983315 RepID=UPI0021D5FD99|nr:hypothetical protein [Actinoplanes sp. KI2]MCU7724355.1 hypothetical protein [Actinoplanes sp. KI2]